MSKHTKGPWEIIRARDGKTIMRIGECSAEEYAGLAWLDVSEANARLIAAAPELLEALSEIVDAADGDGWNQLDATFSKARAAIAKARGEA